MLKIYYHKQLGGWQKPTIIPFQNLSIHPAARVLHYAVQCVSPETSPASSHAGLPNTQHVSVLIAREFDIPVTEEKVIMSEVLGTCAHRGHSAFESLQA
ncbi:hypothetical protein JTB14_013702 [Gonioctena quinquepunctata]|nr:hypothetical protein JTB14_013702 [Gonioctena quinquepunctata]